MEVIYIIVVVLILFLILSFLGHIIIQKKDSDESSSSDSSKTVIVGGCDGTRFGCCNDNITSKINSIGTNCYNHKNYPLVPPPGHDCHLNGTCKPL